MNFKIGTLEVYFIICAAAFILLSVISSVMNKKRLITHIGCFVTSLITAVYYILCIGMLSTLETDFSLPMLSGIDTHATYTTIFMIIIFTVSTIGSAIPMLSKLRRFNKSMQAVYIVYAIVTATIFITMGVNLFTSSVEYNTLLVFLPIHFAMPVIITALICHNPKIKSDFICACVLIGISSIILLSEMLVVVNVDMTIKIAEFSLISTIISIAILSVVVLNVASLILSRKHALKNMTKREIKQLSREK